MLKQVDAMIVKMDEVIKMIAEVNQMRGEIGLYLSDDSEEDTEMLNIITEWMHTDHHAYLMKKHMEKLREMLKDEQ